MLRYWWMVVMLLLTAGYILGCHHKQGVVLLKPTRVDSSGLDSSMAGTWEFSGVYVSQFFDSPEKWVWLAPDSVPESKQAFAVFDSTTIGYLVTGFLGNTWSTYFDSLHLKSSDKSTNTLIFSGNIQIGYTYGTRIVIDTVIFNYLNKSMAWKNYNFLMGGFDTQILFLHTH